MGKALDLTGKKFGRLTVIKREGSNKHKQAIWKCLCECGNETMVVASKLKSGYTQSCGCLQKERTSEASIIHGHSRKSPEYKIWATMLQRCDNQNYKDYEYYGGRGIRVCDCWKSFEKFIVDMGNRPSSNHTIERIDNDKDYNKSNCVWENRTVQSRNQRLRKDNTTGIKGVQWDKDRNKYRVTISHNKKKIYIGLYESLEDAKQSRKQAELKYWGKSFL
ncbi:AP2 domain-containing protein [Alkalihalobacillus hemicellulosilyticus]|uniref:Uncharacterized protein n=1 Tax=Halalkalibacter hemicellulosilyticusJCM 9152 TaxID=1236971 RepID=W4QK06_9BACI|nr:AP2 domain-containing protein [Halalkalibacter hemicellulosilyticus]GAE32435.1 hypothetical protein JCM9152_3970 [Halalkalibacter hemicellulosilyticusJCM 9152]